MTFSNIELSKLSEIITKGTTPTTMGFDFQTKGVNFYKAQDLLSRYLLDTDTKVSIECHDALKRSKIRKNDLLVSIAGTIGRVSLWNSENEANCNQAVAIVRSKPGINFLFNYYALTSPNVQDQIKKMTKTTAQPNLNLQELGSLLIPQPSSLQQKAIANILSSLDDKIELNNKINKNLEELAQTLYKRWFVDFEFPNQDGEPYKSSGGEMVESELGLIPKGWGILAIDELVVKSNTKINPDSNQKLIDMANMPSYSIALNGFDYGDKLSTNTYKMNKFSFLYGSIRPYLGKFGIAPFDGITTGTIHNFSVKNNFDYSLVATTIFSTKFNEFCVKLSHGTKMPTIKWDNFVSFKVIYMNEISKKFDKKIRVLFDEIVSNVLENINLSKLREQLLPKLMSGEIKVPLGEEHGG